MSEDGPLPLARRRLTDAVHSFADPIPEWVGGTARWCDPLYQRLRASLVGRTVRARTTMAGSLPPCRIDALELLLAIDRAVVGWEPDAKGGTCARLHALSERGWRARSTTSSSTACAASSSIG